MLAALSAPEAQFDAVTAQVNALPEVAHNYRREHALNMWFCVAAESPAQATQVLQRIEGATGLKVHAFPKEREYRVELRLPLLHPANAAPTSGGDPMALDAFDRALIAATQAGLPLVPRPYDAVGATLGVSGERVRQRLAELLHTGLVRRIGAVPHHYKLGFTANGMSVWDVADAQVDALAQPGGPAARREPLLPAPAQPARVALQPVRHAARAQPRRGGRAGRPTCPTAGAACRQHDILYSTAVFKKTGLRLNPKEA